MADEKARADVAPGDILAGKYRVEQVLGMGATGCVVAATHMELMEKRAIKFLRPEVRLDANVVERFLREARAAVKLKSQHAVKVQDIGRFETGEPYMVMEHLEGQDLAALIAQCGAIPTRHTVHYVLQALHAIEEAHALGIIHRDLKPANLFLAKGAASEWIVKVLDFGISKVEQGGAENMTGTTDVLGSPVYMAPEQMRSSRDVDARADIWSLGIIVYELLTGKRPFFGGNMMELVLHVATHDPPPPSTLVPTVPPGLDAVVLRCLSKDRNARYDSAAALVAALEPFAQ